MDGQLKKVWVDVRMASFVTFRLYKSLFASQNCYLNYDVSEETPVEMCWHLNVCLLYSMCAFYKTVN